MYIYVYPLLAEGIQKQQYIISIEYPWQPDFGF